MPGLMSTRSPGCTLVTPGPTVSTIPAPSAPTMWGKLRTVPVRTQARRGGALNLGPERRRNHLLRARGGHGYRGPGADRLDVHAIGGIAAVLRLGIDDERHHVARGRD